MRASRLGVAAIAGALAAFAVGCGGGETPVKIGVLTDCQGPFHAFEDAQLAGAELPLLDRGATMRGTAPTDGLTAATVAGRKVELVRGCAESASTPSSSRRRDGSSRTSASTPIVGGAGTVIRDVARLYPTVPVRRDVLGRAGGHPASRACRTCTATRSTTASRRPDSVAMRMTTWGGGGRASSRRTVRRDGGRRRHSSRSSAPSAARSSTRSTFRRSTPLPDPGAAVRERERPTEWRSFSARTTRRSSPARSVTRRLSLPPRQLLLSSPLIEDSAVSHGPGASTGRRRIDVLDPGRPSLEGVGGLPAPLRARRSPGSLLTWPTRRSWSGTRTRSRRLWLRSRTSVVMSRTADGDSERRWRASGSSCPAAPFGSTVNGRRSPTFLSSVSAGRAGSPRSSRFEPPGTSSRRSAGSSRAAHRRGRRANGASGPSPRPGRESDRS